MIDWDKVNTLLQVVHGAATAGPKYGSIVSEADAELGRIMYPPQDANVLPPDPIYPAPAVSGPGPMGVIDPNPEPTTSTEETSNGT